MPIPAFSVNYLKLSECVNNSPKYFMSSYTLKSAPAWDAVVKRTDAYLPSIVSSLEGGYEI